MEGLEQRNPHETEFIQAVREVAHSVFPLLEENKDYQDAKILERMTEPDRIISFRVSWEDDEKNVRVNRAWRVQFNRAIGPYKGGLRFHSSVNQSILKFLGFEQTFKNSLTDLPMGGGKGGSNFNPKGKSSREVMRFCQSFMTELFRHIGPDADVPAGDIGVGAREIGFLFGQYTRLTNEFEGALTEKGLTYGGSPIRKEATGYGAIYFLQCMLARADEPLEGKRLAISGAGNVALFAAERSVQEGAKVVTLSDSDGFIHCSSGLDEEALEGIKALKLEERGRLSELADRVKGIEYVAGKAPWGVECDVAIPCATQNELDGDAARTLVGNGLRAVVEGANMPSTDEAIQCFRENGVIFGPGKAGNAGGVAVSGFEQSQNAARLSWSREDVNARLKSLMQTIHEKCADEMERDEGIDYVDAANRAGFRKVADAMLAYGVT
ncbi:MAG: NADP-specific glutamate dehydrogenase [Deltaproteobacteria bacterium]|nr:NADP-specific glutamate dehydrogenase [Deltaproteobacteria bacterium]